jgi:hypothetical protein
MQYFDETDDKYARLGKVIGDAFAAFIVPALIIILAYGIISR